MPTLLSSTLTCPLCGHRALEAMPTDACQVVYECRGCGTLLRPKTGDCCVFCSYGDVPCPPIQEAPRGTRVRVLRREQPRPTKSRWTCR